MEEFTVKFKQIIRIMATLHQNLNRMKSISLIFKTYLLVLSIFFVFRLILFVTEIDRVDISEELTTILYAFLMGIRFDLVVSGYILCLPALLLIVMENLTIENRLIKIFTFYWIFTLFTLAFSICAADIPYFNHFFARFTIGAFTWFENIDFVFKMIFQEPKYYSIIIPLVGLIFSFYYLLRRIYQNTPVIEKTGLTVKILFSVIFLGLMFLGIRGRIQKKSPIRTGTAYFSNHPFLNQFGLNPVFTFAVSYIESHDERNKKIYLINNQTAVNYIQNQLNIREISYNSPIVRDIIPDKISTEKPNVIIIIMECMSAAKMNRHGNENNLTPFLDSLSQQSHYFKNIYI